MKKKRECASLSVILLCPVLFFALYCFGCSSLPPVTGADVEAVNPPVETADMADSIDLPLPETPEMNEGDENREADGDDAAEVWKRAEETLAYLDTPVNPDLPEPEYVEPAIVEEEPDPALQEGESPVEIAEAPGETNPTDEEAVALPEEEAAVMPVEEAVAEEAPPIPPPPPMILRPAQEMTAAPPPRVPVSVPPGSLAMQPARVPPNETVRESVSIDTRDSSETTLPIRTVRVSLGENAEIPLPGSGWVYLGERDDKKGLAYRSRRMSAEGQIFVFRPEAVGSYRLKFQKQDLLRGTDAGELVEVVVGEKNVPEEPAAQTVIAAEPSVADTETASSDFPLSPPAIDPVTPDAFAVAEANDTVLWNRGQELEAPGPKRDIKGALTAYRTLVRDYPQSEYYSNSQKRIAYLERYFVNIR
jgi:hypothetical protein